LIRTGFGPTFQAMPFVSKSLDKTLNRVYL
jgi:hypothetical protein